MIASPSCAHCGERTILIYCGRCMKNERAKLVAVEKDADREQWNALAHEADLMQEIKRLKAENEQLRKERTG